MKNVYFVKFPVVRQAELVVAIDEKAAIARAVNAQERKFDIQLTQDEFDKITVSKVPDWIVKNINTINLAVILVFLGMAAYVIVWAALTYVLPIFRI